MSVRVASIAFALLVPAVAAAQPGHPAQPEPCTPEAGTCRRTQPPPGAASPYYQPAPAVGQTAAPPTRVPERPARVGLELDIGLQAGNLSCDSPNGECDEFMEAGGVAFGATYMLRPGIGIHGQVWGMGHTRDGWTISQVISTVGVELRPVPILSILVGVGHAHASLSTDRVGGLVISSDDAPAIMLGAGIDVVRAPNWAIDVHAKYGQGFYGDENDDGEADVTARNAGLGAGFTYIF